MPEPLLSPVRNQGAESLHEPIRLHECESREFLSVLHHLALVDQWRHGWLKPGFIMVEKTAAEWKAELTPEQYRVLRRKGTQASGTGEYDNFFVSTLHCFVIYCFCE